MCASSLQLPLSEKNSGSPGLNCPLNHGVSVLDQLLASLVGEVDGEAFDAALDLRWLLSNSSDAAAIVLGFYRLRSFIEERHYLACYRLRRWLESHLVAWVSFQRHQPERRTALRLDAASPDQLHERCATRALEGTATGLPVRVRFAFATPALSH